MMNCKEIFTTLPISASAFARRIGMNPTLMRQYAAGREIGAGNESRIKQGLLDLAEEIKRLAE